MRLIRDARYRRASRRYDFGESSVRWDPAFDHMHTPDCYVAFGGPNEDCEGCIALRAVEDMLYDIEVEAPYRREVIDGLTSRAKRPGRARHLAG